MCGIAGFWDLRSENSESQLETTARKMATSLKHRGPDSWGTWTDAPNGVALSHARLAILDLSAAGHQPMVSQNGRIILTYNGEVYNFQELRKELSLSGVQFQGHSDTEVLVEAFSRWGIEKTLAASCGMFAFAVWQTETQELILGRDRMGQKPLYYGWNGDTLLFASELKAFHAHPQFSPEIDLSAVSAFLRYSCVPEDYSIYRGIHKLPAGSLATFSRASRTPRIHQYWSLSDVASFGENNSLEVSESEAEEMLDRKIRCSIERRLVSDVPLGAFLSGGIDSSLVVAVMQQLNDGNTRSFAIGYEEEKFNEAPFAKEVARHLGTDHHELFVTAQDALDLIPKLASTYDEPFADISQIPTMIVSQLARKHVTVALSGDGGDELFCGYDRYSGAIERWQKLRRTPAAIRKLAGMAATSVAGLGLQKSWMDRTAKSLLAHDAVELFASRRQRTTSELDLVPGAGEIRDIYQDRKRWAGLQEPLNQMMFLDTSAWLVDDVLVKVDRASMAASLEVRNPLLDHELVEFCWQVPLNYKYHNGVRKWLLKQVLKRYVPTELFDRPKRGFAVPVADWLRGPLRDWAESLLDENRLFRQGLLAPAVVRGHWREFLAGSNRHRMVIWSLLMLQAWMDQQTSMNRPGD